MASCTIQKRLLTVFTCTHLAYLTRLVALHNQEVHMRVSLRLILMGLFYLLPLIALLIMIVQPDLQRVAFAKIDVEGFEIAVLKGAWRSLLHPEIHIGSLLMEVGPTRWKRAGIPLQEGIDQMQLLSQRFQKFVLLLRFKGSFWKKCPPSLAIDAKLSDAKPETLDNVHMYMVQANEVVPLLKAMDAKDYDCNFWFENDSL